VSTPGLFFAANMCIQISLSRGLLLALALVLATGCQPVAENHLLDYLKALEAITGTHTAVTRTSGLVTYPSHRQRHLPLPALRLGFGEFFDLYGCRLFTLINERNSIMGRVMPVSQRLVYEIRFLQAAVECRDRLQRDGQSTVIQRLDGILQSKRRMLPRLFWNATFDSPEMARAFSLAVSPLAPHEEAGFAASSAALDYFLALGERLEDADFQVDSGVLESHYQTLQAHHYGGRLATTLALLADYLDAASHTLAQIGTDCPDRPASNAPWRALALALAPVNALVETVEQQGQAWLLRVNRLIDLPGTQPPTAFQQYRARMLGLKGGLWQRFQRVLQHHRAVQQRWLRACAPPELADQLRF